MVSVSAVSAGVTMTLVLPEKSLFTALVGEVSCAVTVQVYSPAGSVRRKAWLWALSTVTRASLKRFLALPFL